jgi:AraC-like DNA-binding protein
MTAHSTKKPSSHFSETDAWQVVGDGWRQLHDGFSDWGFSFEWHDFECAQDLNWAKSFHPDSVEICLNLEGCGRFFWKGRQLDYRPLSAGFYGQGRVPLHAVRLAQDRHRFITVEFSRAFFQQRFANCERHFHPLVRAMLSGKHHVSGVVPAFPMTSQWLQLVASLRHPPVHGVAQRLWYHSNALELLAEILVRQPTEELFCARRDRLACDRVERVTSILRGNLAQPPSLEEIGRSVGCSHFYLCRTFSEQIGMTMTQYLRQLRMERAAELLRSGKYNVTETALEVGYSSLSHFSQAFHETFGCCPGLYPLGSCGASRR